MRTLNFIIFIFLIVIKTSGQTVNKFDTTILLKKNWVQCDGKITDLNHCYECKSAKLTINADEKWGNIGDKKKEIIIGHWGPSLDRTHIKLQDPFLHNETHFCQIITLNDTSLVIEYLDLKSISRQIKFKPR